MRIKRNTIPKIVCGLVVAFAVINLPLPALATEEAVVPPTANTTMADPTPAAPAQPLTLEETTPTPTAVLQDTATTVTTNQNATNPSNDTPNTPQTTATVTTQLDSTAKSGDAEVSGNEKAKDATSGNSAAEATVLNVVNANGASTSPFQTFQCDVDDMADNLIIDPTSLLPICKSTSVGASTQASTNTQGLQTGASLVDILNNIALSAASGNATVSGNEKAGDATTGNASALANVVNIANTAIAAQNSFLGVINIHGELRGNILVPQSIVDSLASGQATGAPIDTTSIINTINANATSGNAEVSGNETGGDATSGEALTSLMVMNLTGQKVVAKNSLLVFVNVLGKWMGLIVPAGAGQTAALLGSGLQQSGNTTTSPAGDTETRITNNISVDAQSGDATVSDNETGGNAATGNAKAGVNLLNITDSEFQLDKWFGILFINVLGSWLGNFDIQAALQAATNNQQPVVKDVKVYQFSQPAIVAPPLATPAATAPTAAVPSPAPQEVVKTVSSTGSVLAANDNNTTNKSSQNLKFDMVGLGIVVLGLTALIASGTLAIRHWYHG